MTVPQSTPVQLPLQIEEWRPVVGWEGWYEVSSLGRVRGVRAGARRRIGHVLRPWPNSNGYPRVGLSRPDGRERKLVHLLVSAAFLGPTPPGLEVNHKDRNPANPAADNLEFVTRAGNAQYALANGAVWAFGAEKATKLTEADVLAIRTSPDGYRKLAKRYGINRSYARAVKLGLAWRHLRDGGGGG